MPRGRGARSRPAIPPCSSDAAGIRVGSRDRLVPDLRQKRCTRTVPRDQKAVATSGTQFAAAAPAPTAHHHGARAARAPRPRGRPAAIPSRDQRREPRVAECACLGVVPHVEPQAGRVLVPAPRNSRADRPSIVSVTKVARARAAGRQAGPRCIRWSGLPTRTQAGLDGRWRRRTAAVRGARPAQAT